MPCLNEAQTLPQCISAAQEALDILRTEHNLNGEIVIADNGSTDGGQQIAESLGARVVPVAEKGYGSALRGGIKAAWGQYIVMGDSDCSYDFREGVAMVAKLKEGYELCMGSRLKGRIMAGAMPWMNRYIGNPVLSGILNLLFRSGLSDAHCGLRAFTKSAFEKMRLTSPGMEFASEMVIKATLLDMRRTEVPITLHPDQRGRPPHLRRWHDGWRHLRYLLMLSPNWLFHIPSAILGFIGLLIFALLSFRPGSVTVTVGPAWFGNHWMVLSAASIAVAHQLTIFGLSTTLFGIREGYRKSTPFLDRVFHLVELENMLIGGIVCFLFGNVINGYVFVSWWISGFGALDMVRELIAGTTIALIGVQNIFGGFFLAIISGNEAQIITAIKETP